MSLSTQLALIVEIAHLLNHDLPGFVLLFTIKVTHNPLRTHRGGGISHFRCVSEKFGSARLPEQPRQERLQLGETVDAIALDVECDLHAAAVADDQQLHL